MQDQFVLALDLVQMICKAVVQTNSACHLYVQNKQNAAQETN